MRTSVIGNGPASEAVTTGRGRDVAFTSEASNLVPGDLNGRSDVFVRGLKSGKTLLVSASTTGGTAHGTSFEPSISDDGRYVAFSSTAPDLVSGQTTPSSNQPFGVFVRDTVLGTTRQVPLPPYTGSVDYGDPFPHLSGDGRYVAFTAQSDDFPEEPFYPVQVYRYDLATGELRLVSASSAGVPGDDGSRVGDISADGRYVAFETLANTFGGGQWRIVRKDMVTGALVQLGFSPQETNPLGTASSAIDLDGKGDTVAYWRRVFAYEDGPPFRSPVVVRDVASGRERSFGLPADPTASGDANHPALSEHATAVVYDSSTPGLTADDPDGEGRDVFLTTLGAGGSTTLVAAGADRPDISGNAAYVTFQTYAALVPQDTNATSDIYRKDLATGAVDLVSVG
ncbi:WD40 repeat protein [Motilibacter rhizosphaerae]|uniref:WD40 repeat protein n=1 Tax=Motilibacter rhizosphaerae TaxID=598652 RepID=A0A4Q7NQF5_9ACTN|nr:WD40 repeat protein [Motilibacter rhizosphaerae]